MSADSFDFANRVGQELAQHLGQRIRDELLDVSTTDQFSAALGASLICVAEVLRDPVERGGSPDRFVALCATQLQELLKQVQRARQPSPRDTGTG